MKNTVLSLAFATLTFAGVTSAQSASFQLFGSSCSTSEGTPTLSNNGLPVLGGTMDLIYSGPNANGGGLFSFRPHLVIGFSVFTPPVTIPQSLFFGQPPNCDLFVTLDVVVPMPESAAPEVFLNSMRLNIPNDPMLLGTAFFPQWLTVYTQVGIVPGAFVPWITTSEAGIAVIGF